MSKPVFKSFMGKHTEAWYQLTEAERGKLMDGVYAYIKKLGIKIVIMCDSHWSNDQWPFFGVEEYPDIEAVQKHVEDLENIDFYRYYHSENILGTLRTPRES